MQHECDSCTVYGRPVWRFAPRAVFFCGTGRGAGGSKLWELERTRTYFGCDAGTSVEYFYYRQPHLASPSLSLFGIQLAASVHPGLLAGGWSFLPEATEATAMAVGKKLAARNGGAGSLLK